MESPTSPKGPKLNVAANAYVFQLNALDSPSPNHVNLHNQVLGQGAVGMLLPKEVFPFIEDGDQALIVTVAITRISAALPAEAKGGKLIVGKN